MIKYVPKMTSVVLEEIPDRVSLAVDISNCRGNCVGCHSPFLKLDIGEELTTGIIDALIADNFGVNCFLFLGEGRDPEALLALARHIRGAHPAMEIALYSGREAVEAEIWDAFDYVKVGPYRPECGPLNERTTNQRLYRVHHEESGMPGAGLRTGNAGIGSPLWGANRPFARRGEDVAVPGIPVGAEDITFRFWRKGIDPNR